MSNSLDTDIANYSLNDLEKLLGLKDNFTKDDIIKKSDEYLKKYKNQKDNNLYNFFVKVREKLLENLNRGLRERNISHITESGRNIISREKLGLDETLPLNIGQDNLNQILRQSINRQLIIDSSFRLTSKESNNNVNLTSGNDIDINATAGGIDIDSNNDVTIDSANGDIKLNSASGDITLDGNSLSLNGSDNSNFTVNGSDKSLTLKATGGGTQSLILNSAGTGTDAINIDATAGGIDIDANNDINLNTSSGNINIDASTGSIQIGTNTTINFNGGSSSTGVTITSAGAILASDDITAFSSSDINLKKNIKRIEKPLEKINNIGGYMFDWRENNLHDTGVIAQEIEKIIPEITITRLNGIKAVKYEKMVVLLIEGMKEQQEQIKDLQQEIKNLKENKNGNN